MASERNEKDPFGFKEGPAPNIDKECAIRLTKFVVLLRDTFGTTPAQLMFAIELMYLNVTKSNSFPLKETEIAKIKKEALDYYNKGTKK